VRLRGIEHGAPRLSAARALHEYLYDATSVRETVKQFQSSAMKNVRKISGRIGAAGGGWWPYRRESSYPRLVKTFKPRIIAISQLRFIREGCCTTEMPQRLT